MLDAFRQNPVKYGDCYVNNLEAQQVPYRTWIAGSEPCISFLSSTPLFLLLHGFALLFSLHDAFLVSPPVPGP